MTGEGEEGEELTSVDEVPFQRRSRDKNINNYLRILMLKNRSVMLAQVWNTGDIVKQTVGHRSNGRSS